MPGNSPPSPAASRRAPARPPGPRAGPRHRSLGAGRPEGSHQGKQHEPCSVTPFAARAAGPGSGSTWPTGPPSAMTSSAPARRRSSTSEHPRRSSDPGLPRAGRASLMLCSSTNRPAARGSPVRAARPTDGKGASIPSVTRSARTSGGSAGKTAVARCPAWRWRSHLPLPAAAACPSPFRPSDGHGRPGCGVACQQIVGISCRHFRRHWHPA
jgi:hypothetical protein